ncbi:integral membrane protein [Hypomontagnella monticulosa]|nr:integral membrane protein [Hypomontagnella monticulosa]
MQLPPASVQASWPPPNYHDPETRGHLGMVVGVVLVILVTIILAIRLYTRKWLTRGFGLDDVFIIAAYFPATAFTIIGIAQEEGCHWNRHTWDVEPGLYVDGLKLAFANEMLFDIATSLLKLSILILLYRLTTVIGDRKMTIAVLVAITFISLNCFVFMMVCILQCTPLSAYWELSDTPQSCINESAHEMAVSIINTVTDWVVVLLPIKTALGLNLPTKQISIVIFLFGLGILASTAGIVRTYYTWMLYTTDDVIWNAWIVWFCSTIELQLGIICASIPATKPFFASHLPGFFGSAFRPRSSNVDLERKPLTHSPSLTTFIDQSSTSSTFLAHHTAPSPSPSPSPPDRPPADLNKPLPPLLADRDAYLESRSSRSDGLSVQPPSPRTPSPPRPRVRFSDHPRYIEPSTPHPRDRTTIFIMYRAENDLGPIRPLRKMPSSASMV